MKGYLNLEQFSHLGLARLYIILDEQSYLKIGCRREDLKLGNYGPPDILSMSSFSGRENFDKQLEDIKKGSIEVEFAKIEVDTLAEIAKELKKTPITISEANRRKMELPNMKRDVNRILDSKLRRYIRNFPFDYRV